MAYVTINDISRELKLSRNTVSKALGAKGVISDRTRETVIKKAAEMGYSKTNALLTADAAPGLKTILVLTRADASIFWNNIIMGINQELSQRGYLIHTIFADEEHDYPSWDKIIKSDTHISGILVLSVYSTGYLSRCFELDVPMVFLDTGISDTDRAFLQGDVILSEGMYAVESLTRHLISQGIKDIGFIGDITYCRTIRDRYDGYLMALSSFGVEPDPGIIASKHVSERYYLKYEVEEALESFDHVPQAVVCANDEIAFFLIGVLNEKGYSVPGDVAVTGYDNLEALTGHIPPFLSTVNIRHAELGRRIARQLEWRIDAPESPKELIMIRGEVIIRSSSAKSTKKADAAIHKTMNRNLNKRS